MAQKGRSLLKSLQSGSRLSRSTANKARERNNGCIINVKRLGHWRLKLCPDPFSKGMSTPKAKRNVDVNVDVDLCLSNRTARVAELITGSRSAIMRQGVLGQIPLMGVGQCGTGRPIWRPYGYFYICGEFIVVIVSTLNLGGP